MVKSIEKRGTASRGTTSRLKPKSTSTAKPVGTVTPVIPPKPSNKTPAASIREETLNLKEKALIELEIGLKSKETGLRLRENAITERTEALKERIATERVITERRREVTNGIVVSQEAGGFYQVRVGQRQIRVKSAIAEILTPNAGVVIGETVEGFFIVGTEKHKDRARRTVVITG